MPNRRPSTTGSFRPVTHDWDTEYLDAIVAVRVVDDVEAAIEHVNKHGSSHTDAIVTADAAAAERFLDARRQRDRPAQRLDAVCRWGRVRYGRGNWYLDGQDARPRSGRSRAADKLQICRAWRRPGPTLSPGDPGC